MRPFIRVTADWRRAGVQTISCHDKRAYETLAKARKALKRTAPISNRPGKLEIYRCTFLDHYHLGHRRAA